MDLSVIFGKVACQDQSVGHQEAPLPPDGSSDLLVYAEPFGGSQMDPAPQINGDLETDPPMTLQGEHPEMDAGFYAQQGRTAMGSMWSPQMPGEDSRVPYDSGSAPYSVEPKGSPDHGGELIDLSVGYDPASDMGSAWNSPAGVGVVASIEESIRMAEGKLNPHDQDKDYAEEALSSLLKDQGNTSAGNTREVVKLASFDQLFAFNKVSENVLIHKSTNDLWKISTDEDGNLQLEREFNPAGIIPS